MLLYVKLIILTFSVLRLLLFLLSVLFFVLFVKPRCLPSFPTRRSSDLRRSRDRRALAERLVRRTGRPGRTPRSEEHTSELQSRSEIVCRLLLEKIKNNHQD